MTSDIDYLKGIHVVRLTAAARMAGLRFKNGTLSKDEIIERLSNHPSIMRAAIATLNRMEQGEPIQTQRAPVKFNADDFADDEAEQPVLKNPADTRTDAEIRQSDKLTADFLRDYAKRTELAEAVRLTSEGFKEAGKRIDGITEQIEALKQRAPIEFHFPDSRKVTIDPTDHHECFPKLVKYLEINRRVILTGSAGTGKSLAAKNAAEALGVPFFLLTPVTMSHELIGHRDATGAFHSTPLTEAYENGGLCLMDESDASLPDALLAANPILDGNGFAMFGDGKLHKQSDKFFVIMNMNTDGNGATMKYAGRNRLDGATLARFGVRIHWGIDTRIERMMAAGQSAWHDVIVAVRAFMEARDIVDTNATPRHLKTGAALLNAGMNRAEVLNDVLKSGAVESVWGDMLRLPAVVTFLRG